MVDFLETEATVQEVMVELQVVIMMVLLTLEDLRQQPVQEE